MIWTYVIIAAILLIAELVYFKIADHFNIIDKPNERSSHSTIVLRGGGIIFSLSMIVWAVIYQEKEEQKRQMKLSLEVYIQGVKDEMRGKGRMR